MDTERLQEGFRCFPPGEHPKGSPSTAPPGSSSHPPRSTIPVPALGWTGPLCSPSTYQPPEPKFSQFPANHSILESWRRPAVAQEWNGTGSSTDGWRELVWPGPKRPLVFGFNSQTSRKAQQQSLEPHFRAGFGTLEFLSKIALGAVPGGKMDCRGQGPHVGLPDPLLPSPDPRREEPGAVFPLLALFFFPPLGFFFQGWSKLGAGKAGSAPGGCLGMCGSAQLSLQCQTGRQGWISWEAPAGVSMAGKGLEGKLRQHQFRSRCIPIPFPSFLGSF